MMVYPASRIKRQRATKAEVEERRAALYEIIEAMKPMTVRRAFYQADRREVGGRLQQGADRPRTAAAQGRDAL